MISDGRTAAALFTVLFLVSAGLVIPKAFATVGSSSFDTSFTSWTLKDGQKMSWAASVLWSSVFMSTNRVNFTNAAYSSSSNPSQTFGYGGSSCDAQLTNILSNGIQITIPATTATNTRCITWLYYLQSQSSVGSVQVVYNTGTNVIASSSFVPLTSIGSCQTPCAASNSTVVEVASTFPTSDAITWFFGNSGPTTSTTTAQQGGGGGGGGGIVTSTTTTLTMITSASLTSTIVAATGTPIPPTQFSYVIFGLLGTAAFVVVVSRRKPIEKDLHKIRTQTIGQVKHGTFKIKDEDQ